jgi:hypothetical protein
MSKKAVTSKRVAKIASDILRSQTEDAEAKSAGGSALSQAPERTPKEKAASKKHWSEK